MKHFIMQSQDNLYHSTDAIANAGGTTINYIDTKTGTDISSYSNILGAVITDSISSTTDFGLLLLKDNTRTAFYFFSSTVSNGCDVNFSATKNIRVFYF